MENSIVVDNEVYFNISDKLKDYPENSREYTKVLNSSTHWICENTKNNFTKDIVYPITKNGYIIDDSGEITTDWKITEGTLLKKDDEHKNILSEFI